MKKLALAITIIIVAITSLGLSSAGVVTAKEDTFPEVIPLPDGFQPEGIAVGRGTDFFVGSLGRLGDDGQTITGGAIYKGDLRTGQGDILVPSQEGRTALGLAVDTRTNHIFVAGGPFGAAYVYDGSTGAPLAVYQFAGPFLTTVVNDVVVTRDAAYFTDSCPVLYKVPLGPGGELPDQSAVQTIGLGGDFKSVPGEINANGIDATPNGKQLVIVNSTTGELYRVDPKNGYAALIVLGGETVPTGDGLLLDGKTLYVVQNGFNPDFPDQQIAVVQLDPKLTSGTLESPITDSKFRIPTTVAEFGSDLYAVNARFDVAPPPFPGSPPADPNLEYEAVRVPKR